MLTLVLMLMLCVPLLRALEGSAFIALVLSTPSIATSSNSFSSMTTSSPAHIRIVGCQTMTMLSSDVVVMVQFSPVPGAQQRSVGRDV